MTTIIQTLKDNFPALKEKYSLISLGVFGSYSRGDQNPNSDLDLIYETLPNTYLNLHNFLNLQKELNSLTHLKVDLVNKKYINEVIWLTAKNDILYV